MALSSMEQFQDRRAELGHTIDLIQRAREGILYTILKLDHQRQGRPIEEIRKTHLQKILAELQDEAASNALQLGVLERNSPAFQRLLTSLHVIFTPEQLRKFREDARPRFGIFRPLTGAGVSTKKELGDSEQFFQNKFKAYDADPAHPSRHSPDTPVLAQHALQSRNMRLIIKRLFSETDLAPGGQPGDLRAILRRHPEIGADIGALLLAKETLDSIERNQEIFSNGRRTLEGIGRSIQEDIQTIFTEDLAGIQQQIEFTLRASQKNYFWGPLSVFLVPLRAIIPTLRIIFAIPRALAVGTRDAFVLTGRANERPRS